MLIFRTKNKIDEILVSKSLSNFQNFEQLTGAGYFALRLIDIELLIALFPVINILLSKMHLFL